MRLLRTKAMIFGPDNVITMLSARHLYSDTNSHNNRMSVVLYLYIYTAHIGIGIEREWRCVHIAQIGDHHDSYTRLLTGAFNTFIYPRQSRDIMRGALSVAFFFSFSFHFRIQNALLPGRVCVCAPVRETSVHNAHIGSNILYNAVSLEWHQTSFTRTIMSLEQCPVMNEKRMVQSTSDERGSEG